MSVGCKYATHGIKFVIGWLAGRMTGWMQNGRWENRIAYVYALGCMLEGLSNPKPLVSPPKP